MGLYEQLILKGLETGELQVAVSDGVQRWLEGKCCQALKEIQTVLKDDSLDDPECFMRIEQIVEIFERLGRNGGTRHDFG